MLASTWPVRPFWARSGGTEKDSITSPRSLAADQAMAPTPIPIDRPTTAVITCSSAFIRSLKRRQRMCDSCSTRCSCRCSVCSSIRWVCFLRKERASSSMPLLARDVRPSARAIAAGLAWSRASSASASDSSSRSATWRAPCRVRQYGQFRAVARAEVQALGRPDLRLRILAAPEPR